jgi:hypothetical protein
MGFPELDNDESVILQAHSIKVKSVVFEAVLTNKRIILIDGKKGLIPTQEILIATINTVDGGENAIRDPILTFSIYSIGGSARQMILTFPREARGERRRERDDWLRELRARVSSADTARVVHDTTAFDQHAPHIPEIVPPSSAGVPSQKKKIEITPPRRSIIESAPAMPRPVETTSLPVGSFCNRCGNRVPPDSVFCNRCGTPVVTSTEQPIPPPAVIPTPPAAAPPVATPSSVPQVQVPTPPVFGLGGDYKEPTLNEVIHSIEPLIEDSKPRSGEAAPLVPRHYPAPPPPIETPVVTPPVETPVATPPADTTPQAEVPAQPAPGEPVPAGATASPVPPALPPKKSKLIPIAVIAVIALIVIGGIALLSGSWGTTPGEAITTPAVTPVPTTAIATPTTVPTPIPTATPQITSTPPPEPVVLIPPNGVWVRITYAEKYSGTYGTPGGQTPVSDTGDHFYMVSTVNGPVVASIQKLDGSSGMLAIEVYKNGELMKRETTIAPRGVIDLQVDLKPVPTPTPVPTLTVSPTITPALNATVNGTATA